MGLRGSMVGMFRSCPGFANVPDRRNGPQRRGPFHAFSGGNCIRCRESLTCLGCGHSYGYAHVSHDDGGEWGNDPDSLTSRRYPVGDNLTSVPSILTSCRAKSPYNVPSSKVVAGSIRRSTNPAPRSQEQDSRSPS